MLAYLMINGQMTRFSFAMVLHEVHVCAPTSVIIPGNPSAREAMWFPRDNLPAGNPMPREKSVTIVQRCLFPIFCRGL